jgi:hypothetical protein
MQINRWQITLLSFLAIVFGWWYIALPILIYGLVRFPNYFEIIIMGIIYDATFRMVPNTGMSGYVATITTFIIFASYQLIKGAIRR